MKILIFLFSIVFTTAFGQFFHPKIEDKLYLESLQTELNEEMEKSRVQLMEKAKIIESSAKNFIGAKLKENLFVALRVLAEKELDSISIQERQRQPRQDDDDDEDGAAAGASLGTTRRNNVIPQVAGLLKAIFGGNINVTAYVESASGLLPKPIQNQLVGLVNLFATNPTKQATTTPAAKTAATTAPPPPPPPSSVGSTRRSRTRRTTLAPKPVVNVNSNGPLKIITSDNQNYVIGSSVESQKATIASPVAAAVPVELVPVHPVEPVVFYPQPTSVPQPPPGQVQVTNRRRIRSTTEKKEEETTEEEKKEEEEEGGEGEEYDYDIDDPTKKQRQIDFANPFNQLLGGLGTLLGGARTTATTVKPEPTTENIAGFEEESTTVKRAGGTGSSSSGGSGTSNLDSLNLGNLAEGVRNGIGDLLKVMPDIFRGTREAFKLLTSVSGLFGSLASLGGGGGRSLIN